MTNSSGGIGDISLLGAYRIFEQKPPLITMPLPCVPS